MVDLLVVNAGELITCRTDSGGAVGDRLKRLEVITDGAVAIEGDRIAEVGRTADLRQRYPHAKQVVDAQGMVVSPGLVDCHSHLLYGGSRHEEYEMQVAADSDPSKKLGGGIRYTVSKTRAASEEELRGQALFDLDVMLQHGTTTLEAKTGYGLDRETELRMLKVQSSLQHPVDVVSTYLGAHVPPQEYQDDHAPYVDLVIDMLGEAKAYAEYCDVCCDPVGFTYAECARICDAAKGLGFGIKVHADQTGDLEGAKLAAEYRAASADHLDYITEEGIRAMVEGGVVGVLLPGVNFHMMELVPSLVDGEVQPPVKAYLPKLVHQMIAAGMRLAISADFNPGSSPCQSLQMSMQLAARLYRLNYAQIWHMSTINAAHALDRGHDRGSLEAGKLADLVLWRVPYYGMVIHRFGVNLVSTVIKSGEIAYQV